MAVTLAAGVLLGGARPASSQVPRTQAPCNGQQISNIIIETLPPSYGGLFSWSPALGRVARTLHTTTDPRLVENLLLFRRGELRGAHVAPAVVEFQVPEQGSARPSGSVSGSYGPRVILWLLGAAAAVALAFGPAFMHRSRKERWLGCLVVSVCWAIALVLLDG
jgi:hypothetical protein